MQKYRMMRTAAGIFRILGWVILGAGIIGSIIGGVITGGGSGAAIAILGIIYSVVGGIFVLAAADFFYCVMDIEENTRHRE